MLLNDTVAGRLGRFVAELRFEDLPSEVVEKARACLLFAYGIGIGSNHLPYAPVARRAAFAMDGEHTDGATVFGVGCRTTISAAVVANGALFHGRNQEDTCGSTHAGVVIVPLLTALIESRRLPVEHLLPCIVAGYEVACTLDQAFAARTTPAGFRATPIYGAIGAELARAGSVSAPLAFEGRAGFARAHARTDCDVDAVTAQLGRQWKIMDVAFKPYPLPAWNQTPVTLALRLRGRLADRALRRVRVRMNPYEVNYPGKDAKGPFENDTEAKLSISFSVATTLAHGVPTFARLLDYRNDLTAHILRHVEIEADAEVPRLSCRMTVELASGEVVDESLLRTWRDYSFDCTQVSAMVREVGGETGVPAEAFDRLERFVRGLPQGSIDEVIGAFGLMPADTRTS